MTDDIDAIAFEVLRHRLWSINVEGAIALQRVSGSPLATEAFDMNTAILTAEGEVAFVGPYLLTGPTGQGMIVRHILDEYDDNPGISPGDMFICNDPYTGAAHQNCVTLVAPVHHRDALVAWCGATLHVVDLGGPHSGQVGVGARSIFEEPAVIPPLKIVAGGQLLRDVEATYLRRSRTPELNALDLRGEVAAISTIRRRLGELIDCHGAQAITTTLTRTIDQGEIHLRRRLRELPDGTFSHTAYLDERDGDRSVFYRVDLTVKKEADRIHFDFSGSSSQAGAVINCTRSALRSGVVIGVLAYLVYDAMWCPAAVDRVAEVESRPGTVVDASWPAGCSMATMAAGFAVTTATAVCLARLLAASDDHRAHAMAAWAGAVGSVDVFGTAADGRHFGTVLLDSMASGGGARTWADGIDGGGFIRSMAAVVANVEDYESRYPLLYLYRRYEPDTGGPGRRRGGVGVAYAVVPHGVDSIDSVIPHFSGTQQPESVGLAGGHPGATNQPFVIRDSRVGELLAAGFLPTSDAEVEGTRRLLPGVARIELGPDDIFGVIATGGGGWGDPLDRPVSVVAADVRAGLVSASAARRTYGVILGDNGTPDEPGSSRLRHRRRRDRARRAGPVEPPILRRATPGPLNEELESALHEGRPQIRCPGCGYQANPGSHLPGAIRPLRFARSFRLVELYCPSCWRLVWVDRTEAPIA